MRPSFTMPGAGGILLVAASLAVAACGASSPGPSSAAATPASTVVTAPASVVAAATATPPATPVAVDPSPTADPSWHVVAIGDSIPFNSPNDCPGCTGFVDGYAKLLEQATGHPTTATNLSEHNGLQGKGLSTELDSNATMRDALAGADVVIVSIGHNDTPWNVADDACDGAYVWDDPFESNVPYAAKYTTACAKATAAAYEPTLASIYHRAVALREGRPTVFLALNTYNDFTGWCEARGCDGGPAVTPPAITKGSRTVLDAWNTMVCDTAKAGGVQCADVYHLFGGPKATSPAGDLLGDDYTHPSQQGNDKIADLLLDIAPTVPTP